LHFYTANISRFTDILLFIVSLYFYSIYTANNVRFTETDENSTAFAAKRKKRNDGRVA